MEIKRVDKNDLTLYVETVSRYVYDLCDIDLLNKEECLAVLDNIIVKSMELKLKFELTDPKLGNGAYKIEIK
jgi:hypothetical protein